MKVTVIDPDVLLLQERFDQGELAAAMLDRHYAHLHFLAYSILGDATEADDAVQETMVRSLAKIDRYQPGTNMKAWLSSILVHYCQDTLRRRKARHRLRQGLAWLSGGKPAARSAEATSVHQQAREALWATVDGLGEKHRLPVILRYVHNLTIREISQILGIREGTVHSRLHYACRKLGRQFALQERAELVRELLSE